MLDRRSFIRNSTSLALAAIPAEGQSPERPLCHNKNEWVVARCKSLDFLGRPRSWSHVRDGLYPISPERVVVLTERGGDCSVGRDRTQENSVRDALGDPAKLHATCMERQNEPVVAGNWCEVCRYPWTVTLPEGKLELIFRLIQALTIHYQVPHLFPRWATGVARREALASTGMGRGFALLHQFQDDGLVQLTNPPVDWWLGMFPEGINWNGMANDPVFGIIGHIFPSNHAYLPGLKMQTWELTECVGRKLESDAWRKAARLDRLSAAQTINREILLMVEKLQNITYCKDQV